MNAIKQSLRDSRTARWIVLLIVSFAMLTAYMFMEILSPLKTMIQNAYGWDNTEWGAVTGAQGYLNVFAGMLILGGIILDKMGIRFTAVASAVVMLVGAAIKYYAIAFIDPSATINIIFAAPKAQVFWAASGFAIFCVGAETAGITVSKILVKWFKGKELALSMGLEMASARLGSALALFGSPRLAEAMNIPTPILISAIVILIGLVLFLIYSVMDAKLDKEEGVEKGDSEEEFKISDLGHIIKNPGFWYISLLCVLFYSAVFPFYKYGPDLMVNKYGVDPSQAGDIPGWLPIGTMLLTPVFGMLYDRKGKGASIMILGAILLIGVHFIYYMPSLTSVSMAYVAVLILGVAFSLVPSAMWPSVPKIVDERYLGSAYALIFFIQNIGLMGIPILVGKVLDINNPGVADKLDAARDMFRSQGLKASEISDKIQAMRLSGELPNYDYTNTWLIFIGLTVLALVLAFGLKFTDKKRGYGLELPNIQQ
ncbi:MFS transporter [Prolixibacteraceae bacterium JC049]|nr:MFS transporter [Prolixibacteraceae bacterium JC049]